MENKISKLRELMKKNFIDTYIIDLLQEIYDKVLMKVRSIKNEIKERKERKKHS